MLNLRNIEKKFATRAGQPLTALRDINLTVKSGEFITIVGPSGCGKSTLLNIIAGLLSPSAGTIEFNGAAVKGVDRRIGYVTQSHNLFPWRTLKDNVSFPLEITGIAKAERNERAEYWINRVGLRGFENSYPHELSGGMRQRGNIVRTLIYGPSVILMDEPFGPLDAQTRITLQELLLELWAQTKSTVVFITHDLAEAVALGDRVILMGANPGRIINVEPVEIARPRDIHHLHDNSEFRAVYDKVWNALKVASVAA